MQLKIGIQFNNCYLNPPKIFVLIMCIPLRNREDRRVSVFGVTPSVETDQAPEEHRITTTPSLSPSPPLVLQSASLIPSPPLPPLYTLFYNNNYVGEFVIFAKNII